jgi:hypothetical protein
MSKEVADHKCSWGYRRRCGKPAAFRFHPRHWLCPRHARECQNALGALAVAERIRRNSDKVGNQ